MPQIIQLEQEGHCCREIAKKVGISKSAVNRWLQEWRRKSVAQQPETAEPDSKAASRLERIFYKSMQGFNASQADKRIRIVEESEMAGGDRGSRKKETTRIETQAGNPYFLGQARGAATAIEDLNRRTAARRRVAARPRGGPIDWATLTDDDLESMTDEQLYALEVRLLAENGPGDGPVQTAMKPSDLRNMTDEQLYALEAQLLAEIKGAPSPPESP